MRWIAIALLCSACANRPLPSTYVGRETLGLVHDAQLDAVRHSFDPTRRNTIAFANDLVLRGEGALEAGDSLTAITRAQDGATTAGYALASRSTRERLRARAWRLESRAWAQRGYAGRSLVAYALAGLATDYVESERAPDDDAEFDRTVRQLDQQVAAANEADNQATMAAVGAILGAAAAAANAVSAQMRANQADQSPQMRESTQAIAQRAMATSVQAAASAASTTSEAAALASRMDEALQQASADTRAELSLQTPEIATARTPLSQIARFYLEASQGDGRYLRHLARRLAQTQWFRPAGLREAILLLDSVCVSGRACEWSDDANRALNLVWILAMRETRRVP